MDESRDHEVGWARDTIWWHVYPLGFVGAPIRETEGPPKPRHRLNQVVNWLDYAVDLGTNGLLLGPIFQSDTHGYDSTDLWHIDDRLGDEKDFEELIDHAHRRGVKILLDGVFSHVGVGHPDFQAALAEGPSSPQAQLFDIDWEAPGGPAARVFEGHGALVRFNHTQRATEDYVVSVMNHWLDRGADGWRLDAAYSVDPAFWARVLPRVRERHPEAWFLGEVIHGDYTEFVQASTVNSVTQYELWKAIWSSLLDENFFELDWSLKRHDEFLTGFVPNTFVGNHDVTRIASRLGAGRAVIAFAILMTVGGIPSVYYGDEQGFTGIKEEREAGDDAVRPPMPSDPAELAAFGEKTYACYRDLIGLRRRHPWLTTAHTEGLEVENTRYRYRTTAADGSAHLDVEIDLVGAGSASIRDAAGNALWTKPDL